MLLHGCIPLCGLMMPFASIVISVDSTSGALLPSDASQGPSLHITRPCRIGVGNYDFLLPRPFAHMPSSAQAAWQNALLPDTWPVAEQLPLLITRVASEAIAHSIHR